MDKVRPKVFSNKAITLATLVGGPISAGFLISKNYIAFGDRTAANHSVYIGIITTLILFGCILIVPEEHLDGIAKAIVPLVYTSLTPLLVYLLQGKRISKHFASNGIRASNWLAGLYGLIGATFSFLFLFAVFFLFTAEKFENKIIIDNNTALYFGKKVNENHSTQLADLIRLSGFLEGADDIDIFMSDNHENYLIRFILTDTSFLAEDDLISDFYTFEKYLNYNRPFSKSIEVGFTDIYLIESIEKPILEPKELHIYEPLLYLNYYQINQNHTIYYNALTPTSDIEKIEDSVKRLRGYFPENIPVDFVFLRNENDYTIKFFVSKQMKNDPEVIRMLKSTVEYISHNGINEDITLVLVDNIGFEENEVFKYQHN